MKIVKHSGAVVEYNPEKLKNSLSKSGAGDKVIEGIMQEIQSKIYEGISTKQIYKMAIALLKKTANHHAARYNLREAIRLLGPAGFFFEKYTGRLFASEGYKTMTNLTLFGKCVSHEVDVFVKKEHDVAMVECKFHMGREAASDVKVPMYILSRFNDLKERKHRIFTEKESITKCWIVTNNRFTSDAIDFSKCMGLNLLSWDYPHNDNLKTKNDVNGLYPITCLTTLTFAEKDKLLNLDIILVRELASSSELLNKIGLSPIRIKNVLKEAAELCRYT